MKIIALVLLVVGIGLSALGAYGYFLNADQERCLSLRSEAVELFNKALAAEGTPRGAALTQEAREVSGVADVACSNARQTQQSALLAGLGGVTTVIVSVLLLVIARKRRQLKV